MEGLVLGCKFRVPIRASRVRVWGLGVWGLGVWASGV